MKEEEIRPQNLLTRYLELSAQDAARCFSGVNRRRISCVGCGGNESAAEFVKDSFEYTRCSNCGTLYQSPRPGLEAFEEFYRNSESSRYWAEVFFPAVAEIRREKIFRPRVERLSTMMAELEVEVARLIDVGAGYGIFLDEWRSRFPDTELIAVEPSAHLAAECRNKGLTVVEAMAEQAEGLAGYGDLAVCFEVLEHVDDPCSFLSVLRKMVKPGGYVFISTLCIDGFDLQVLWEKSSQISPPHHINFLSVAGLERVFERAGLVETIVVTPGQLDVDIVRNAAVKDSSLLDGHRFIRSVLADDQQAAAFQRFLSENRLSSHAWVLGKNPIDV